MRDSLSNLDNLLSKLVKHKFKENENTDVFGTLALPWYLFLFLLIKGMQTTGSIC